MSGGNKGGFVMRDIMKGFLGVAVVVVGLSLSAGIVYGCYWVAKTVSYSFFYEDMVIRTIHQQVKPEHLK
jgi:uncharacterized protein (DUF697 family)